METCTLAITAPEESVTVPLSVAPDTCAWAERESSTEKMAPKTKANAVARCPQLRFRTIITPSFSMQLTETANSLSLLNDWFLLGFLTAHRTPILPLKSL